MLPRRGLTKYLLLIIYSVDSLNPKFVRRIVVIEKNPSHFHKRLIPSLQYSICERAKYIIHPKVQIQILFKTDLDQI